MQFRYFLFPFLFLLLNANIVSSQEVDDKIESVLEDHLKPVRGKITEENGVFSLFYFDAFEKDTHAKYLQEKGYHGGGPSWLAIIYTAFNIFEPNIIDGLKFDVDVSGVTFKTTNKEDLHMISRVIALIKSDEVILNEMISRAKALDIMK